MNYYTSQITRLIEELSKLPGIGSKSAQRLAFHIINMPKDSAKQLADSGVRDVFLMTTAEFSQERYLDYGRAVRAVLPDDVRLVANVGDFDEAYALRLRDAGFTGVYHICRLGEGVDTGASVETRVRTLDAVKAASREKNRPLNNYVPLENTELVSSDDLTDDIGDRQLMERIRAGLNGEEEKIFELWAEGCSYAEIAEEIKKSVKYVDNALQRIRRKAKKILSGREDI